MNLRKPLFAALAAVLMFGLWFADRAITRSARLAEIAGSRLIPFDAMDARDLSIENDHGRFAFERRGDDWWMTEPVEVLADRTQIVALIDNLHASKMLDPFRADSLAPYGLDDPSPVVVVRGTLDGGEVERTVMFGGDSPHPARIYAMTDGSDDVAMVGNWMRAKAGQGLDALRDKALLRFDKGNVESFAVAASGKTLTVKRSEKFAAPWEVVETGAPASPALVDRVLSSLSAGRAVRVEDNPTTPRAQLGLDPPFAEMRIELTEGERTLRIGSRVADANEFFAESSEQPGVCTVAARSVADVLLPPTEWTSAQLVWHRPEDFVRIETTAGSGSMAMVRDASGGWIFEDAPGVPVHAEELATFLANLSAIAGTKRETGWTGTDEERRRFGFREGTYRVEIETKDGARAGFVQGRTDTVEGITWLNRVQDDTVWSLPAEQLHLVVKFRRDLEDRRVAPDFAAKTAAIRLAFHEGESAAQSIVLRVEKSGEIWRLIAPKGRTLVADWPTVDAVIRAARNLEWEDIAMLGERKPVRRIEFLDAGGAALHWIEVYKDGEKVFFRTEDNVFFAPAEQANRLDAAIAVLVTNATEEKPAGP